MKRRVTQLVLILICSAMAPAAARVIPVSNDLELGVAIESAVPEDFITIQPGLYFWPHDHRLRAGAMLRGATGDPADVIIDLGHANHRLTDSETIGTTGKVVFQGLTLRNFQQPGYMVITHCSLLLENCRFTANEAHMLFSSAGRTELRNCEFLGNTAERLLCLQDDLTVTGCRFSENDAPLLVEMLAGGLSMSGTEMTDNVGQLVQMSAAGGTFSACEIVGNLGGVGLHVPIDLPYPTLAMTACTVRENSFPQGALRLDICTALFDRCEIRDNTGLDGAAILAGELTFVCCDIDLAGWELGQGDPVVDDSGCDLAPGDLTLGGLKAMFR